VVKVSAPSDLLPYIFNPPILCIGSNPRCYTLIKSLAISFILIYLKVFLGKRLEETICEIYIFGCCCMVCRFGFKEIFRS